MKKKYSVRQTHLKLCVPKAGKKRSMKVKMTLAEKAIQKVRNKILKDRMKKAQQAEEAGEVVAEKWQDLLRIIIVMRECRFPPPHIFLFFTCNECPSGS